MNDGKPRVVFLNRCYWPDTEATGQLLEDLCGHLSESYDVHVVCGQPNSPKAGVQFLERGIQVRDGISIHRVRHTRFAKRVPAGRIINLLSFSKAASRYLSKTDLNADILVTETDPFLLPIVASKHAKRSGAKLISYLQDIYPDVAEAIGKASDGFITRQIRRRLRSAYQASQRVIVLGSCMKERLASKPWKIDANKIEIIPNWADTESIRPVDVIENPFRTREGLRNRFVVMHSGNMGLTQRLDVLVRAATSNRWPPNAVLMLVGDGAAKPSLQQQVESLDGQVDFDLKDRIRFLPYQPREQLAESLSAGDVHIVSMHQSITGCLCPSKLYGILAAGRGVIAVANPDTDLAQTVSQNELGWVCQPGSHEEIAECVKQACLSPEGCAEMGQRARQIAESTFDRKVVTGRFKELLDSVHQQEPAQKQ